MLGIIISLVSGAVGGNVAGAVLKKFSLGTVGNSICGILGGGLGGSILGMLGIAAAPSGSLDPAALIGSIASGGAGGGVVMAIVGAIKGMMAKK